MYFTYGEEKNGLELLGELLKTKEPFFPPITEDVKENLVPNDRTATIKNLM